MMCEGFDHAVVMRWYLTDDSIEVESAPPRVTIDAEVVEVIRERSRWVEGMTPWPSCALLTDDNILIFYGRGQRRNAYYRLLHYHEDKKIWHAEWPD